MAIATNVLQLSAIKTEKDAVESVIAYIDKHRLPFYALMKRVAVRNTKPEHTEGKIPDPVTTPIPFGEKLEASTIAVEVRKWVATQKIAQRFNITLEADLTDYHVDIGRNRTFHVLMEAQIAHKEAIETICIGLNKAPKLATAAANGNKGQAASFSAMAGIQHNQETVQAADSGGNKGVSGGWSTSGNTYGARTDASDKSRRKLTQAMFDAMTTALKNETDDMMGRVVFANMYNKQQIATFSTNVPNRNNLNLPSAKVLISRTVDLVKTVTGDIYDIRFNRFCRKRDVIFVNPRMACIKYMYLLRQKRMPEEGYYASRAIGSNFALELKHDKAHGLIGDLTEAA